MNTGEVITFARNTLVEFPGNERLMVCLASVLFAAGYSRFCVDRTYGEHNRLIARMYTLLSLYLWQDGKRDEAFAALDRSLCHFRQFEELCAMENARYTAPLIRLVAVDFSRDTVPNPADPDSTVASLYRDWPWWHVEEESWVKEEMQADPRWEAWVRKCNG